MAPDPQRQLGRLLESLPRVYTEHASTSALGDLLFRAARSFAVLDDDMRRVMYDRWIGLASGERDGEGLSALERLGQLIGRPRLTGDAPGEVELAEDYRRRLQVTAQILTGGLTTPASLLGLAVVALGKEPCPRVERTMRTEAGGQAVDATVGWGLPPGARRGCAGCNGPPGEPCPRADRRQVEVVLSENPTLPASHIERGLQIGVEFVIANASLSPDRPALTLTLPEGAPPLEYPALQSRGTGEVVLVTTTLYAGEQLVLLPAVPARERQPFDDATFRGDAHHTWLRRTDEGQAYVLDATRMARRDVRSSVWMVSGSRFFDVAAGNVDAVFDGAGFNDIANCVTMPQLAAGDNTWRLLSIPSPAAQFDEPSSRFGGEGKPGSQFAASDSLIADLVLRELASPANTSPGSGVTLRLDWSARPPFTCRLVVPLIPAIRRAGALSAAELLSQDIDRARAAGVRVLLSLAQPPWQERVGADERGFSAKGRRRSTERGGPRVDRLRFAARLQLRERQPLADGALQPAAPFDHARFNQARFR